MIRFPGETPTSIILTGISGTHSSGKTTTINGLSDPVFEHNQGLDVHDSYNLMPRYGASLLTVPGLNTEVPLVTGEEAATFYALKHGNPAILTTDYSFEHQIMIEADAVSTLVEATEIAVSLAQKQPAIPNLGRVACVVLDRTPLDGLVYSSLRTPEENQEMISIAQVNEVVSGQSFNLPPRPPLPLRQLWRDLLGDNFDAIFMADAAEVIAEDNGLRLEDDDFRSRVAVSIDQTYRDAFSNVVVLRGSEQERIHTVKTTLAQIVIAFAQMG